MWFRKYICLNEINKHISIGSGGFSAMECDRDILEGGISISKG